MDVSPAAVRCARLNAVLNEFEERIEPRLGDLFEPVAASDSISCCSIRRSWSVSRRTPDAAWRSEDTARRFAAGLGDHLVPGGAALVLLSSFGDACPLFESELRAERIPPRGLREAPLRQRNRDDPAGNAPGDGEAMT